MSSFRNSTRRLCGEYLESRTLLTNFHVDAAAADGGTGHHRDPFNRIQDAIDAALVSPGADAVLIAPGHYSETLEVNDDPHSLTIRGTGGDAADVVIENSEDHGIKARDSSSLNIRDLTITLADGDGVNTEDVDHVRLRNVDLVHNKKDGLQVESALSAEVTGGNFSDNGDRGIKIEITGTASVQSVIASDNGEDGIKAELVDDLFVLNATAERNGDAGLEVDLVGRVRVHGGQFNAKFEAGLEIDDSPTIWISHVTAIGNMEHGLQITAGDDGLENSVIDRVTVLQSLFSGNTGDGINIRSDAASSYVDRVFINHTTLHGNTESGYDIAALETDLNHVNSFDNGEPDLSA